MAKRNWLVVWGALAPLVVGCSTVTVRVPVMHPAEINLHGKDKLVIGTVTGPSSSEVTALLKDRIVSSGRFKLVDRAHLNSVLSELQLSASDLANPDSRRKLGKLMTGSILLAGNVERANYNENMSRKVDTCQRNVNGRVVRYRCVHRSRTGEANVTVDFDVIDIATGQDLKPKRVQCERRQTTRATNATPSPIDGQSMVDGCMHYVVDTFMKAIAPWQGYVNARFLKDGDLPSLALGITYAKQGQWSDAIKQFNAAIQQAGSKPGLAVDTVAKAYWDLGLAKEYTFAFDDAIKNVKKAFQMTQNQDYLREVNNINHLRQEQEKLQQQTGSGQST